MSTPSPARRRRGPALRCERVRSRGTPAAPLQLGRSPWAPTPVVSVRTRAVTRHSGGAASLGALAMGAMALEATPHTLRHTAATWLMQRGVPVWEAAGFLGMSPEMLAQTYGHHHQDYLRNAANKIGTKPDALVVSLEEAKKRRAEKQKA
jgi:hypothetical protein